MSSPSHIKLSLARLIVVMDWYVALLTLTLVFWMQHNVALAIVSLVFLQCAHYAWETRLRSLAPEHKVQKENEKAFIRTVALERIATWFILFNVLITSLLMPQGTFIVGIVVGAYILRRSTLRWGKGVCLQHHVAKYQEV
jgi:hypothetical protein